jgi:adenosine deaminase
MKQIIKQLPKIELHLHLDCSLSFNVVNQLRPGITDIEYRDKFIAPEKCYNLAEFLKCAQSGIDLMQTEDELIAVVKDLFIQLKKENVIYAEIRFAPLLHLNKGLSPEKVVEIVADEVKNSSKSKGIEAGLILCTLRHFSEKQSLRTIELVGKFIKDDVVVGFDLAADEAGYTIDNQIKAFKYAIKKDIPRTAHAGEAKGAESVWETLKNFKPQRIGHGVRSLENPQLIDFLVGNQIHLEVCPTCNIQTNVFNEFSDHPIDKLYKSGVSLSINTDARSLVNINLTDEYFKLMNTFGWEIKDFLRCNLNTISKAFISEDKKDTLRIKVVEGYKTYLQ